MADSQKTAKDAPQEPAKEAKEAAAAVEVTEEDEKFPVERLVRDGAKLVGHPPHVVAGALSGISKKNLTQDEAKAAVKAWLKTPVTKEA